HKEHPAAVAVQPEYGGHADADDVRHVVGELVVEAEPVGRDRDERELDEQTDAVEDEEQDGLTAQAAALPVPERPQLVAEEGEDGGDDGGDRHRGQRAESGPVAQPVSTEDGDEEREDADDAELGYLVYQHPESGVNIAEEIHSLSSFVGPSRRIDPTLPCPQVVARTGP